MNSEKIKVIVYWQANKAIHLPTSLEYITVAKFDENWMNEAWSIILEFDTAPNQQGNPSIGYARFLMPNGPEEKLVSGTHFELYEGRELTAKVIVI